MLYRQKGKKERSNGDAGKRRDQEDKRQGGERGEISSVEQCYIEKCLMNNSPNEQSKKKRSR